MARKGRRTIARSPRLGCSEPVPASAQTGTFRKEGEYWTLGVGGRVVRLKDTKGLAYLAHLLRYPTTEFHVLDLAAGISDSSGEGDTDRLPRGGEDLQKAGIHVGRLGDAGEVVDDQAKRAYRRRLAELRQELDEAKELGEIDRAEQLEDEIDALNKELSRAVGLGGRNRRSASASERARQSVTKTVKTTLAKIAQVDSTIGAILTRDIRTGTFCSYRPDPNFPIAWEFGAITIQPQQPSSQDDPSAKPQTDFLQPPGVAVSLFPLAERTTFVGREMERNAIHRTIDRALNGNGSLVMIGGGPGVGKTRLAMEMTEYASQAGFRCFVGHCYERDEQVPYLPFVEIIEASLAQAPSLDYYRDQIGDNAAELAQLAPILRNVFPDIPPPSELPPAEMRRHLFQRLAEMLARMAQNRPLLMFLDDLHWADESTLALLIHLANRIAQHRIAIIGTYRDGFSDDGPALIRTLEELIRLGIRPLKIVGLSKEDVAHMLHALSGRQAPESLVWLIFEETQGNPFFVEEVYQHLMEDGKVFDAAGHFRPDIKIDEVDVPENVRLIINRRLERLNSDEKKVLEAAAVIGRSFSFQLLSDVTQAHIDNVFAAIEKGLQMGIVVSSSQGPETPFTFAHELVRQTMLAGILPPARQRLHSLIATALERLDASGLNRWAGEIADHLLKAGSFADRNKLVFWLTRAGKAALEAAAFEEAQRSFRSALASQDAIDPAEKAELLSRLAIAHRGLGQWEAEITNRREALEICINLGDRGKIGSSVPELTEALRLAGRYEEATDTARRGLAYLQAGVSADRVRLLAALARILGHTESYEAASEVLREASVEASQLSDPGLEATLLIARSTLNLTFLRLREALADALSSQRSGGSAPLRNAQLAILLQVQLDFGHMDEVLRISEGIESLAKKVGLSPTLLMSRRFEIWAEFGRVSNLTRYQTDLRQVLQFEQALGYGGVVSEACLCLLDFLRGEWPDALAHAETGYRLEAPIGVEGIAAGMLFLQRAYTGERDGAFAVLNEKQKWLPCLGHHNRSDSWLMLATVVEGLVMLGERAQARELYPLVRELLGTGAVVLWLSHLTQTIAGIAAAAAGQWEDSEGHFRIALQQAESLPYRLEQVEIRRFHAMMLLDRAAPGDRERARTLLREALDFYTRIGMRRHSDLSRALLKKAGG